MTMPTPRVPAIVPPGTDPEAEQQALVKASFQRRLSAPEQARLDALSFSADASLEQARALAQRAPDVASAVFYRETREALPGYEARRQAALAAGKAVADLPAGILMQLDSLATEYRATEGDPHAGFMQTRRDAFRAAVMAGDFGAVVRAWTGWIAECQQANTFARRRASVRHALGRSESPYLHPEPTLVIELEQVLGGSTIDARMPIVPRG